MLLGLVLGAATVAGIGNAGRRCIDSHGQPDVGRCSWPTSRLFIPLAVLAIPLARRADGDRSAGPAAAAASFTPTRSIIHHRLMDLGHGHRQAVIVLYIWFLVLLIAFAATIGACSGSKQVDFIAFPLTAIIFAGSHLILVTWEAADRSLKPEPTPSKKHG